MPLLPGLMPPTASTSVTFALGISSFFYYNYIGIRENGLGGHLRHFAGPVLFIAPLMFLVELISNFVRPISLGVRLFGNMFSDEQVASSFSGMAPPYTFFLIPALLMPLSVFVAIMQTFIFVLLSILYISEVTHGDHGDHEDHDHSDLGNSYTEHEQPSGATAIAAP
jgi:F-type H+-transporting ATPase subunit a